MIDPLTKKEETLIRRKAGESRCPVEVQSGYFAPRAVGERGKAEFKKGGACRNFAAARRAGYRVTYIRSTRCVEVGELWVTALRMGLLDGPSGILQDWLMDQACSVGA